MAEEIRATIAGATFSGFGSSRLTRTATFGVASYERDSTIEQLLAQADAT